MNLQEQMNEVLHSPFSIETHKKTFKHYFEVMIDEAGDIHYAVPSHQQWLINRIEQEEHLDYDGVLDLYKEHQLDFLEAMLADTGCIAVWEDHYVGHPTNVQFRTLRKLQDAGLFFGAVPLMICRYSIESRGGATYKVDESDINRVKKMMAPGDRIVDVRDVTALFC